MATLHIHAQPEDVAPWVLLPGDPGRARYIAENFLEGARVYTTYRGLLGFTGTYQSMRVSVQTTGMGSPSSALVAEELIQLGARGLVRLGTCGAVDASLVPGDLVVAQGAVPLDGTTRQYLDGRAYAPIPSFSLTRAMVEAAERLDVPYQVGLIASEDAFYATTPKAARFWRTVGVLAFEMEAAALFLVGKMRGVNAAALLTVANQIGDASFVSGEVLQVGVERMVRVALGGLMHWKETDNVGA